jgi:hypothetical protein
MLTSQDFAGRVLSSLEDLRERLAVLEAEVRHVREGVARVEAGLRAHAADQRHGNGGVTIRVSRRALGGGGLVGGSLVAVLAGVGKALGWW